jgi:predicted alpha/beta superfamily hydrolase
MTYSSTLRVVYPLAGGRMVLRTDADWEADIEPRAVSAGGTAVEFLLASDSSFLYFKPCIVDRDGLHWAVGNNYLAILNGGQKEIYPHFFTGASGRVSEPIRIASAALGRDCVIRTYHPPGYDENTLKRYPTLYMHDGVNLFFPEEAFLGREWRIDETMAALDRMSIIDKVLVVGVYAEDRMNDFTAPGYYAYGRFLAEELKPAVDRNLRTLADAANTAVMGSSLGGVVSFHLAWQRPELFGKAACMSSTFTFKDDLLARVAGEPKKPVVLYLDSGWPGDNYEVTRSLRDLLARRGYRFGDDLLYFAFPDARHDESSWATRTHIPFQFFFGKTPQFTDLP